MHSFITHLFVDIDGIDTVLVGFGVRVSQRKFAEVGFAQIYKGMWRKKRKWLDKELQGRHL